MMKISAQIRAKDPKTKLASLVEPKIKRPCLTGFDGETVDSDPIGFKYGETGWTDECWRIFWSDFASGVTFHALCIHHGVNKDTLRERIQGNEEMRRVFEAIKLRNKEVNQLKYRKRIDAISESILDVETEPTKLKSEFLVADRLIKIDHPLFDVFETKKVNSSGIQINFPRDVEAMRRSQEEESLISCDPPPIDVKFKEIKDD